MLILDEPTRGIDIGAKVEVHRIISELAASGLAIVLISSDLPEVLAMCDRIARPPRGPARRAEIAGADATEEARHVRGDGPGRRRAAGDAPEPPRAGTDGPVAEIAARQPAAARVTRVVGAVARSARADPGRV